MGIHSVFPFFLSLAYRIKSGPVYVKHSVVHVVIQSHFTDVCVYNCVKQIAPYGWCMWDIMYDQHTHICVVTEVTISVLVNELRGLKLKHKGFQHSSIMVWRDAVKRQFITSGELGPSWHPCQVCGIRSCICVFVYVYGGFQVDECPDSLWQSVLCVCVLQVTL